MKSLFLAIPVLIIALGCNDSMKKRYEEYDAEDFIEVQGIIIKSEGKASFPNVIATDIYFIYNLDKDKPDIGYELRSPYMLDEGEPVIVLVHKDDKDISFFGARGIIEEETLLGYLEKCEQIGGGYYGVDE